MERPHAQSQISIWVEALLSKKRWDWREAAQRRRNMEQKFSEGLFCYHLFILVTNLPNRFKQLWESQSPTQGRHKCLLRVLCCYFSSGMEGWTCASRDRWKQECPWRWWSFPGGTTQERGGDLDYYSDSWLDNNVGKNFLFFRGTSEFLESGEERSV